MEIKIKMYWYSPKKELDQEYIPPPLLKNQHFIEKEWKSKSTAIAK